MGSARMARRLNELDRLVNDRDVLLDNARVWDLLDELSTDTEAAPVVDWAQSSSMKALISA